MPKPPDHGIITELDFITNYLLLGCVPPTYLLVEFSRAPALDLLGLIVGVDTFDIAQSMFDPRKKRIRKSGRHGRKARRFNGIPDVNDLIGDKLSARGEMGRAISITPTRIAFEVLDQYERVAFTFAAIGGIEDLAFETLYGVLSVSPNECREFARLSKHASGDRFAFARYPNMDSIQIDVTDFNNRFGDGQFGTATATGPYRLSVQCYATNTSSTETVIGGLAIGPANNVIKDYGEQKTLPPGARGYFEVSCPGDQSEFLGWGWAGSGAMVLLDNIKVLAFTDNLPF